MCKADKSPVTAADHEIESALCQVINEQDPHYAIISEKHRKRPGINDSWILDPNRLDVRPPGLNSDGRIVAAANKLPSGAAVNSLMCL